MATMGIKGLTKAVIIRSAQACNGNWEILIKEWHSSGIGGITAVSTVLPRYWGQNTRDSRKDEDQSYGTNAAVGLSFSHVQEY